MSPAPATNTSVVTIERPEAQGPFVLVCEHASNAIPAAYGSLGLTRTEQAAHIAWDPGALGLARGLARRLDATLVAATVSRLVYDCNRAPDRSGAMAERSETYAIPGNTGLTGTERAARAQAVYLPFHAALRGQIIGRMAQGLVPAIVTIHSFTPTWFGTARPVEFGVIHDADAALADQVVKAAQQMTPLNTRLNEPYSAADDVTHTLRLQATPYGLPNVMLEVRNDLITDEAAQDRIADLLAPVLTRALAALFPASAP